MSDDIDIEEHDILDNPRIRNMLSHIVSIKSEPMDLDDKEEYDNAHFNYDENYHEDIAVKDREDDMEDDADNIAENGAEDEGDTGDIDTEDMYTSEYTSHAPCNKIILGSKPTPRVSLNSELRIELEDWNERLRTSKCYCHQCKRLFATRNDIDAHNMATHSFLVPLDGDIRPNTARKSTTQILTTSTARKSTAKNPTFTIYRKSFPVSFNESKKTARKSTVSRSNTARKSTSIPVNTSTSDAIKNINIKSITNSKFCNHCNKYFSNSTLLIKHLYELLTGNSKTTDTHTVKSNNDIVEPSKRAAPCYQCSVCSCYYLTSNKYQNHMKNNHNRIATICETKNYTGQCPFCKQTLVLFSSFNKHIKTFHFKHFTKQFNKPIVCTLCNNNFATYSEARHHRRTIHPTYANKSILKNLDSKSVRKSPKVAEEKVERKETHSSLDDYKFPIPKSVLFKCSKCQNHFLNCASSVGHKPWCNLKVGKRGSSVTCVTCKRLFKSADIEAHYQQHKVSDKLKIYIIHDHMHSRVVCKCPKCDLCFDEKKFFHHIRSGCLKTKSVHCAQCNMDFHANSIELHKNMHTDRKFIRDDFILVEFIDKSNDAKSLKRTLPINDEATKSKLTKYSSEDTLLYCNICRSYMKPGTTYRKLHFDGACKKLSRIRCRVCGLSFTSTKTLNTHILVHRDPNMDLNAFTFFGLVDDNQIAPPLPEFPYCKRCRGHTLNSQHKCNVERTIKCKLCKKVYLQSVYTIHLPYHSYKIDSHNDRDELPKLMEKYESLTTTWNILYMCQVCNITTDSYDKVVEHAQNHYSKLEHYGVTISSCNICNLNFDKPCYLKHLELHNSQQKINRNSFMILTFNYNHLLTDKWNDLFQNVSTMQIRQILSKSIYVTLDVKMRLLADGFSELTLYKCKKCNLFVDPSLVSEHVHSFTCGSGTQNECSTCYVPFTTLSGQKNHEKLHKIWSDKKSFRIVGFNEIQDASFNSELRKLKTSLGNDKKSVASKPPIVPHKGGKIKKRYKIFKCVKCSISLLGNKMLYRHVCIKNLKQCDICSHYYAKVRFNRHLGQHSRYPKLTANNIITHLFDPDKGFEVIDQTIESPDVVTNDNVVFEVYQCRCGLHFTTEQSLGLHIDMCGRDTAISKEKCSKCGLMFPTQSLVSHLCKHHSKGDSTIVVKQFVTYYKCNECQLHFGTMAALSKHTNGCDKALSKSCDVCRIKFHSLAISTHRAKHRRVKNLEKRPVEIVTIGKTGDIINTEVIDLVISKSSNKTVLLYKCRPCNIHFMTNKALLYHKEMKHEVRTVLTTCTVCGLRFTNHSIKKHRDIHHKLLRCRLKDFEIITEQSQLNSNKAESNVSHQYPSKDNKSLDVSKTENADKNISSLKSIIDISLYSNRLYKCSACPLCFLLESSLMKHQYLNRHTESKVRCSKCSNYFTKFSLIRHNYVHHQKLAVEKFLIVTDSSSCRAFKKPIKSKDTNADLDAFKPDYDETIDSESNVSNLTQEQEDAVISDKSNKKFGRQKSYFLSDSVLSKLKTANYSNTLYKCHLCPLYFLNVHSLNTHFNKSNHADYAAECKTCGLHFSTYSIMRHEYIHHKKLGLKLEDFIIHDSTLRIINSVKDNSARDDNNETTRVNSVKENAVSQSSTMDSMDQDSSIVSNESEAVTSKKSAIELFKCGDCNVFFLNRSSCSKHSVEHVPLPAREYIECKLCGFQFKITTLMAHIKKHHEVEFKLENVLIEEYRQDPKGGAPKIETYYAVERDQSTQVSTTAEINDSNTKKSNDLTQTEQVSNNEINVEKIVSTNIEDHSNLKFGVDNEITSPNTNIEIETKNNGNAVTPINNEDDNKGITTNLNSSFAVHSKETKNGSETVAGDNSTGDLEPANVKTENGVITCNFCSETFKSQRAREFHENLDHLDEPQNCRICSKSINMSILKELHLAIKDNIFTCCICNQSYHVDFMDEHSNKHRTSDDS